MEGQGAPIGSVTVVIFVLKFETMVTDVNHYTIIIFYITLKLTRTVQTENLVERDKPKEIVYL